VFASLKASYVGAPFLVERVQPFGRLRLHGVRSPHRCAVGAVDHHVAVVLGHQPTAGVVVGGGVPHVLPTEPIDDQVEITVYWTRDRSDRRVPPTACASRS
jgi:hypothetical protein